jgi:hypothetical protein
MGGTESGSVLTSSTALMECDIDKDRFKPWFIDMMMLIGCLVCEVPNFPSVWVSNRIRDPSVPTTLMH